MFLALTEANITNDGIFVSADADLDSSNSERNFLNKEYFLNTAINSLNGSNKKNNF